MVFTVAGVPAFRMSDLPQRFGGGSGGNGNPLRLSDYRNFGTMEEGRLPFATLVPTPGSGNMGGGGAGAGFNINLNVIKQWHQTSNATRALLSSFFPNIYMYEYDGDTAQDKMVYISDGGNDMFDGGEIMSVSGSSIPENSNVTYGDIWTTTTHGYFVGDSNAWPHLTLAYCQSSNQDIRIGVSGNAGSDGEGVVANWLPTNYQTNNARYGQFWLNFNGETSDPSINSVWFTVFDSNAPVSQEITLQEDGRKMEDDNNYSHYMTFQGTNMLAGHFMFGLSNGAAPFQEDVMDFVAAMVAQMPIIYSASNANIDERNIIGIIY